MGNTFDGRLLDERQGTSFGRWPTGFSARRGRLWCWYMGHRAARTSGVRSSGCLGRRHRRTIAPIRLAARKRGYTRRAGETLRDDVEEVTLRKEPS